MVPTGPVREWRLNRTRPVCCFFRDRAPGAHSDRWKSENVHVLAFVFVVDVVIGAIGSAGLANGRAAARSFQMGAAAAQW